MIAHAGDAILHPYESPGLMRILIVKLSSIGDVVHTLPAAALLRRALPGARITWVVERGASAIASAMAVFFIGQYYSV